MSLQASYLISLNMEQLKKLHSDLIDAGISFEAKASGRMVIFVIAYSFLLNRKAKK